MTTEKARIGEMGGIPFRVVLYKKNAVVTSALNAIDPLPIIVQQDAEPTLEEVSNAIDSVALARYLEIMTSP